MPHAHGALGVALRQERVVRPLPGAVGLLVAPDQERRQSPPLEVDGGKLVPCAGVRTGRRRPVARVVRGAGLFAS